MKVDIKHTKKGKLNLPDKNKMLKVGLGGVEVIRKRTIYEHKDVDGKSFKKYSPSYRDYKKKVRPGSAGVDLQLTGKMMANLKVKRHNEQEAVIGFSGINAVKAIVNDKVRHFFALSKAEFKKLIKKVFKG